MIEQHELDRFNAIRERLFDAIKRSLEEDSHCKGYEGAFSISVLFPSYFDRDERFVAWNIHLDLYLLGPHRHYDWRAKNLGECLDKVEHDINLWIADEWETEPEYRFEGWKDKYTEL